MRPSSLLGGKAFAFISMRESPGSCGFLNIEAGDLRREKLDFAKIWNTSRSSRRCATWISARRCGGCESRKLCGGCRARAYALTGDYIGWSRSARIGRATGNDGPRAPAPKLDALDEKILAAIQSDFPLVERPFEALAAKLGVGAEDLVTRFQRLHFKGFIRKLGAVFDARRLGYVSTLVAARIPRSG